MSTAAKGHSAARALPPRLLGWKTALTANSSPVATQMPADRRHRAAPKPLTAATPARCARVQASRGPPGRDRLYPP